MSDKVLKNIFETVEKKTSKLTIPKLIHGFIKTSDLLSKNEEILDIMDEKLDVKLKAILDIYALVFAGNTLFDGRNRRGNAKDGNSFNLNRNAIRGNKKGGTAYNENDSDNSESGNSDSNSDSDNSKSSYETKTEKLIRLGGTVHGDQTTSIAIYESITRDAATMSTKERMELLKLSQTPAQMRERRKTLKEETRFFERRAMMEYQARDQEIEYQKYEDEIRKEVVHYGFAAAMGASAGHMGFFQYKSMGIAAITLTAGSKHAAEATASTLGRAAEDAYGWLFGYEMDSADMEFTEAARQKANEDRLYRYDQSLEETGDWFDAQYYTSLIIGAVACVFVLVLLKNLGTLFSKSVELFGRRDFNVSTGFGAFKFGTRAGQTPEQMPNSRRTYTNPYIRPYNRGTRRRKLKQPVPLLKNTNANTNNNRKKSRRFKRGHNNKNNRNSSKRNNNKNSNNNNNNNNSKKNTKK